MPYIITTKPSTIYAGRARSADAFPTRRAVATLEEAQQDVHRTIWDQDRTHPLLAAAYALPESGGTVGPLPDGTVIEVERVDWPTLGNLRGADVFAEPARDWQRRVIDAFNAAQHP